MREALEKIGVKKNSDIDVASALLKYIRGESSTGGVPSYVKKALRNQISLEQLSKQLLSAKNLSDQLAKNMENLPKKSMVEIMPKDEEWAIL